MVSDVVIRAEGLGKKYLIGHQSNERYTALRDVIARSARSFARTAGNMLRGKPLYEGDEFEEFWALKGVSFEIGRGDVVGIIGRNGAGKSTLLKILSRITEPSEGRVEIRGRVASLLEVGTGFHPELTGRENIFLNGAILGMTRAEIRRKFDEIIAFAEIERFLDTPVKRYSSGMYVRLAFAVAAHLEPEVLIVDEVLAVGDSQFQQKCIGKMTEVASDGRTVLFVSHQLDVIGRLCSRATLLEKGKILLSGKTDDVIFAYQAQGRRGNTAAVGTIGGATVSASLISATFDPAGASQLTLKLEFDQPLSLTEACLIFSSPIGQRVALSDLRLVKGSLFFEANQATMFRVDMDRFNAVAGEYKLTLWICNACGGVDLALGEVTIPPMTEVSRLSLYPESLNGVIRTYGKVVMHHNNLDPHEGSPL